jgi:hypothetical protein
MKDALLEALHEIRPLVEKEKASRRRPAFHYSTMMRF